MRNFKHKQGLTLLTLAVALGMAVYLNWEYAKTADNIVTEPVQETAAQGITDELEVDAETVDKNYGEAQLVSVTQDTGSEFFDSARLSRTKSRDEALDKLKKSLKNASLTKDEKTTLTQQLTEQIDSITAESEVETLIKAKGFADCVTFIDGGKVNVTVMTANDSLGQDEVAQIRDIVLSKCSVSAQNITVVEVK